MVTASDGLHFVYQPLAGDGTIMARVVSVQGSSAAQAGIMVREMLERRSKPCVSVRLFDVDIADGADEHGGEQFVPVSGKW